MARARQPHRLSASILIALASLSAAHAVAAQPASLMAQSQEIPEEFRAHLFGVPLAVRVELDQQYLGDGQAVVTEDDRIQLIALVAGPDSSGSQSDRDRWLAALSEPLALGSCATACPAGLLGLHYSLEHSLLSISTTDNGTDTAVSRRIALPKGGSTGLMLRNDLAVSAGQGRDATLNYNLELRGSLGPWSTFGRYQYLHSSTRGDYNGHQIDALYAQRELGGQFLRGGLFTTAALSGLRAPSAISASTPLVGAMLGSSDALRVDVGSPALYPIHVTATGPSTVEILRDGQLLATQQIGAGIQPIDTTALPGGIYVIELRVIENGQLRSRDTATVHKPNQWGDLTRRWRYAVHVGRPGGLTASTGAAKDTGLVAGAVVNHLLHPRAVVSASIEQAGGQQAASAGLDWSASDRFSLYGSVQDSSRYGRSLEAQAMYRFGAGSLMLSHAAQLATPTQERESAAQDRTTLTWSQRVGLRGHLTARASTHGQGGSPDLDLGFSRSQTLWGQPAHWRVSVYDRARLAMEGQGRTRGIDLTLNVDLGTPERRINGSLGKRSTATGSDLYARAGLSMRPEASWLDRLSADVSADRRGLGLDLGAGLAHPSLGGDVVLQRSTDGHIGGTLHLSSQVAVGQGHLAVLGRDSAFDNASGIIIDVDSDEPDTVLRAFNSQGVSATLRPGRNFVPVPAYRAGELMLDFDGKAAPSAVLQPATLAYHLNKGGVLHTEVKVLRTVTVMGQVVDAAGAGANAVHVLTAAGRTVSQDGGFFAVEADAGHLQLELKPAGGDGCTLRLDPERLQREGDVLMLGTLSCPSPALPETP